MKRLIILSSFFSFFLLLSCSQKEEKEAKVEQKEEKVLDMYETSELADLMRKMYEDNLEIRKQILEGNIPASFPEDFYTIHTAQATDPSELDATFKSLADTYLLNMKAITESTTKKDAKIAYNNMIMTCASCHQLYCQGPLPKIRRMTIKDVTTP